MTVFQSTKEAHQVLAKGLSDDDFHIAEKLTGDSKKGLQLPNSESFRI